MALKINLLKVREHGAVAEVRQDVVNVTGLTNCMNGQLVTIGAIPWASLSDLTLNTPWFWWSKRVRPLNPGIG